MIILAAPFIAVAIMLVVDLTYGRYLAKARERRLDTEARVRRGLLMVQDAGRRPAAWKVRAYARVH